MDSHTSEALLRAQAHLRGVDFDGLLHDIRANPSGYTNRIQLAKLLYLCGDHNG